VRCDVGGQVRVGRIGQVVAERDPDAVARRRVPITTTLASGTKPTRCGTTASSAAGELGRTTTLGSGAGEAWTVWEAWTV